MPTENRSSNTEHALKIHEDPFAQLLAGAKTCEVRKDDRGFAVGDTVQLHECGDANYTGRTLRRTITHIQRGYGLPEGLCVLSYAQPAVQHQGKPVLIQAVAVTREDDDEGLRLEWLLEGGISEMEFPGMVLFALPDANDLCEKDGSAEVYLHPPAADGFSPEQMATQGADGYRNGIKAAAELAADYPELAQAIRVLPLPQ